MSSIWLKNFVGLPQGELDRLLMPRERAEYTINGAISGLRLGALLGSIGYPLYGLLGPFINGQGKQPSAEDTWRLFIRGGAHGALYGVLAGALYSSIRAQNLSKGTVYATNLARRNNSGKRLHFDRVSLGGGILTAAIGGPVPFVILVDLVSIAELALRS